MSEHRQPRRDLVITRSVFPVVRMSDSYTPLSYGMRKPAYVQKQWPVRVDTYHRYLAVEGFWRIRDAILDKICQSPQVPRHYKKMANIADDKNVLDIGTNWPNIKGLDAIKEEIQKIVDENIVTR